MMDLGHGSGDFDGVFRVISPQINIQNVFQICNQIPKNN